MDDDSSKSSDAVNADGSSSTTSEQQPDQSAAAASDAAKNTSNNTQSAPTSTQRANTIKITAKKGDKDQVVHVDPNADVKELRAAIASVYQQPPERVTIVYAGKILKDGTTVTKAELKDQHSVHVVIRQQPAGSAQTAAQQQQQQTPSSNAAAQPRMATQQPGPQQGGLGGLFAGLNSGGAGGLGGMLNMTPETVQQVMNSPLMDNIMANPEVMRMAVQSNPQLRQLMEQNPELNHALNNPDVMRQALQIARNPGAMNEMMRHYDRALSNLEALPGGMNALQRYYNEYQEPMMDAMTSGANPFAQLASQQGGTAADQPHRAENTAPLPNPWSSSSATGASTDSTTANNPFAQLFNAGAGGAGGAGGGGMSPFMLFGGQQPGGQQAGATPAAGGAAENNMMQAVMQQLMGGSGGGAPGSAAGTGSSLFNPAPNDMLQAMSNPQVQAEAMRLLNDRRALEAMHTLHEIAPTLFPVDPLTLGGGAAGGGMNVNNLMSLMFGASPSAAASPVIGGGTAPPSTNTPSSNAAAQPENMHAQAARVAQNFLSAGLNNTNPATTGQQPGQMNNQQAANLAALFSHAMSSMSQGQQQSAGIQPSVLGGMQNQQQQQPQDPAVRFRDELEQLNNMGFTNRDANIRALLSTFGDVNAAVDRLLSGGQGGGGAPGL